MARDGQTDLSRHILPTAATMVGVCITVVGIVRLVETSATIATVIDNVVAVDAVVFLASALCSYAALRGVDETRRLERLADALLLFGLVALVAAGVMLAWELG